MKEKSQEQVEQLVSISAMITATQRDWLDQEVLRRSQPGKMESISGVIRSLIKEHQAVASSVRGGE